MPVRNVTITDQEDKFIQFILESGKFRDADEVFRAGINMLIQEVYNNMIDLEIKKNKVKGNEDIEEENQRESILNEAAGMWKNRNDLPDISELRRSWDRD